MRLHLLDATFELFRAFFALPAEHGPRGEPINAVRGLIATTLALLREPDVTHVGCATDHVIESFRNQLFDGYKTGEGIHPDLWAQFPLAEEALRGLGLVVWPMVEFEADDAMATAAHRLRDQVEQVVILSPDKDLMQCVVGQQVVTHNRLRRSTYDEAAVTEKLGVPPASVPDLLALVGDTADGIPGVPGWGLKSAAAVLRVYRHLETIPPAAEWTMPIRGAERLAATLAAHRTDALLYKQLATLRTDVPLAETLDDLRWRGARAADFTAFCAAHGLGALAERPHRWA
jgi:5'-3' exonuclease